MKKTAVILAGGLGTRLKPYTISLPKPLVPIGDKPIIEIIILQLANEGFDEVVLAVNHQADLIKAYLGSGDRFGVSINYSLEKKPLGTMGPLKYIHDLPDDFLVMNGDILSDISYCDFLNRHIQGENSFTVSTFTRNQRIDYGVIESENGILNRIKEKPVLSMQVSMGVYAVNKSVLRFIPDNEMFGFDDLIEKMLAQDVVINTVCYDGYWMDIGRPEDYEQACRDYEKRCTCFKKH